jgi:dienelactone hydrolase
MILLVASLIVATMSQAPIPAQQSSPDVVLQARVILTAIVAGDFPTVETVGANKPFKDLATGLASRGIAELTYDKRTLIHRARVAALKDFTVKQEVIDDALEAVKALRAQLGLDPRRVFVLGHSLGGMLIPRIGTADPTITGLIILAGAAYGWPRLTVRSRMSA